MKEEAGKELVFDPLRKKWVVLTPEEWVRLNFIQYLLQVKQYPASLVAIEKELQLGELKKRFDILVYNRNQQPWMLVECKSPAVPLEEKVLDQVLRYNISVPVSFLVLVNGSACMAWMKKAGSLEPLREIPLYNE